MIKFQISIFARIKVAVTAMSGKLASVEVDIVLGTDTDVKEYLQLYNTCPKQGQVTSREMQTPSAPHPPHSPSTRRLHAPSSPPLMTMSLSHSMSSLPQYGQLSGRKSTSTSTLDTCKRIICWNTLM